jgi:hypothetical protein
MNPHLAPLDFLENRDVFKFECLQNFVGHLAAPLASM